MKETYQITLSLSDRLTLWQSSALNYKQVFSKDVFNLKKSDIQFLSEIEISRNIFLCCFEKNGLLHSLKLNKDIYHLLFSENKNLLIPKNKALWSLAKPNLLFMFLAIITTIIIMAFFQPSYLERLFASETCYTVCTKVISELVYTLALPQIHFLGVALLYLTFCAIAVKFFKLKLNRPLFLIFPYLFLSAVLMNFNYKMINTSPVKKTISHWRNGTLNYEMFAQIKIDAKKQSKRVPTAQSQNSTDSE